MALSKRIRFEILRRDDYACRYCGAKAPDVQITVDHVIPQTLGGTDDPTNLVSACWDCNAGKSSTGPDEPIVAQVADDAERWASARDAAQSQMRAEREALDLKCAEFREAWTAWDKKCSHLPSDWDSSVTRWLSQGFSIDDIIKALDIALGSRASAYAVFRYMSGIMRNWGREVAERTQQIVDSEVRTDG